jgi:hypothetical protein
MTSSRRTINATKIRRDHHNPYQKATKALLDAGMSPPVSLDEARVMVPWAIEFRYDDVLDERLDRAAACRVVEQMRAWVDELLIEPII